MQHRLILVFILVFTIMAAPVMAQQCVNDSQCNEQQQCLRGQCVTLNPVISKGDCRVGYESVNVPNTNGAYLCVRSSPLNDDATFHVSPITSPTLDLNCRPNLNCPEGHKSICQSGKSIAVCRPE